MEPSFWPVPVRPTLGAALLRCGDAARTEAVFREDLRRWPRNGWGLFGREQALRAQSRTQPADDVRAQFLKAWQYADVELTLTWFWSRP